METTTLTRNGYSNPFFINGRELYCICFYKDGKIIAETQWFGSNNLWERVDLPFAVRNARKVDFGKKDAFVGIYENKIYKAREKQYALYIPADFVGLEFVETKDHGVRMLDHHTSDIFRVKLNGLHSSYVYDKEKDVCDRVETEVVCFSQEFDCNHKFEHTEDYYKCDGLAEKINKAAYLKLSVYDVEKILQHFDITEKKKN